MTTDLQSETGASSQPLFYKNPVVLRYETHRKAALKRTGDFGFSAAANAVPLLVSEFGRAVQHYPIVFTDTASPYPLAMLGLRENQNLFIGGPGSWRAGTYVPAYLRRYPFTVANFGDQAGPLLAIDTASERVTEIGRGGDLDPLFEDGGGPSPVTAQAMAFCHAFHQDHLRDEGFGRALLELGLLVQRHAVMQFPDNSRYTLNGFCVVDAEKFRALSDADLLIDWHRRGWISAIDLHLASMNNWETLLLLNAEASTTTGQGVA
ncbi:SapC family protein [Shinella sp. NM-101]|uniref:SapC family protein n=1 Tax=Shinella sp. NM-101 TaxID=2744455 RepID=UPI001F3DF4D8|nr:SapC family protein [Shinella sp. NM-101]